MVKYVLLFMFLINSLGYGFAGRASELLVVALMVKNEEVAMQSTLQPFLDAGIQSYLILDTGSIDKTIEVTQNLFKKYNVTQGYIIEQPFVDFSTSRNYALNYAKDKFPHASFILMFDAEWIISNVEGLLQFCKEHADSDDSYLIRMDDGITDFFVPRLINAQKDHFFVGAVHEHLACLPSKKVPNSVFFKLQETHYGIEKSKQRWKRDIDVLLQELQKNPRDTRTLFYLAQTYDGLEDFDNARKYYKQRLNSLSVDQEESFIACYNLGQLYHFKKPKWSKALYYYLKAYDMRPIRAEPLYQIALYYFENKEYYLSYWFALNASKIPFPECETHPIFKKIYTYHIYDVLSCAAWFVAEYKTGEASLRKAIALNPEIAGLRCNLDVFLHKLSTESIPL